jgi:galactoside O-acetyltransferase
MPKLFGPTHYTEEDLASEGFKHLGKNVRIARNCTIIGAENISIGDNVRIDGYCTIVAAGEGFIDFGSYIHVGGYCALLAGAGITFEDFSGLSWGVQLFTRSDDFSGRFMTNPTVPAKYTGVTGGPIVLKRHALVGAGSILLPKVTLGEGVAVGALSLVKQDLPEWGIYSGVPARHIKNREKQLLELEYAFLKELVSSQS